MAAKDTTLNELGEMLARVVEQMVTNDDVRGIVKNEFEIAKLATKTDIAALSEQVVNIERDLKQIKHDLYELADKFENIVGYRKEIDHALERIAAIEKHLGIKTKLAA